MRGAVLTLSVACLISPAVAQESQNNPADPQGVSGQPIGIAHHQQMVGQPVANLTFVETDGIEVPLSSYRGKPLLIDLWATWCGPCLAALPSLNRIYAETRDKGLQFVTLDQVANAADEARDAARATEYLAQHHYNWKNFHDGDRKVARALQVDGVPLVVLIANGKIVYFDFGGNEANLRKAIAGLSPQFASVAPLDKTKPDPSQDSPHPN